MSALIALQEQLGLKLDSAGGPVEMLVVDSVQETHGELSRELRAGCIRRRRDVTRGP